MEKTMVQHSRISSEDEIQESFVKAADVSTPSCTESDSTCFRTDPENPVVDKVNEKPSYRPTIPFNVGSSCCGVLNPNNDKRKSYVTDLTLEQQSSHYSPIDTETTDARTTVENYIWVEHPLLGYSPAIVIETKKDGSVVAQLDDGSIETVKPDEIRPIHESSTTGVSDLLNLDHFGMGSLLHNTRVRYFRNEIYTAVGPPILISINPYAMISKLYSLETASMYRARRQNLSSLPPHLYRLAQASLTNLFTGESDQAIIISGESGAGKTEATKIILGYLSALDYIDEWVSENTTLKPTHTSYRALSSILPSTGVENQIVQSNPILESFGNAKTIRNDNSSRFGKFTQVFFDLNVKRLVTAQICNYLLEKSRIVVQQENERNYHIFYQLCAGYHLLNQDVAERLSLDTADHFQYLVQCPGVESRDDLLDFQELLSCLDALGFSDDDVSEVFSLVAAILHLGNVSFEVTSDESDDLVLSHMSKKSFEKSCELLGLQHDDLLDLLKFKSIVDATIQRKILLQRNVEASMYARDSLSKAIYERLFGWLVKRVNSVLGTQFIDNGRCGTFEAKRVSNANNDSKTSVRLRSIGLLDIFGFEVFEKNSFEQLCINFANEQLQQHFNLHVFREEQSLYQKEGIEWEHITYEDNVTVLDTLTNKVYGIFSTLDSECLTPGGCDSNFLQKVLCQASTSTTILQPSILKRHEQFGITHYTGPVFYDVKGMVDKNRDRVYQDFFECFSQKGRPLLVELFKDNIDSYPSKVDESDATRVRRSINATARNFAQSSVSFTFRSQLNGLMDVLQMATASYIRCIKPNGNKSPKEFDAMDIVRQYKCAGMVESIRIRKNGYAIRIPFLRFLTRYKSLLLPLERVTLHDIMNVKRNMMNSAYSPFGRLATSFLERYMGESRDEKTWQIGVSKVFIKEELHRQLEEARSINLSMHATKIASHWKRYLTRKRFLVIRDVAVELQNATYVKLYSYYFHTQNLAKRNAASYIIQTHWRQYCLRNASRVASHAVDIISRAWLTYRASSQYQQKTFQALSHIDAVIPRTENNTHDPQESTETVRQEAFHVAQQGVTYPQETRQHVSIQPEKGTPLDQKIKSGGSGCPHCIRLAKEVQLVKTQLDHKATMLSHAESRFLSVEMQNELLNNQVNVYSKQCKESDKVIQAMESTLKKKEESLNDTVRERDYLLAQVAEADDRMDVALKAQKSEMVNRFSETLEAQRETLMKQITLLEQKVLSSESTVDHLRHLQTAQRKLQYHDIEDEPIAVRMELRHASLHTSPLHTTRTRSQHLRKENESLESTDMGTDNTLGLLVEGRASRNLRNEGSIPATYIALKEEVEEGESLRTEVEALRYKNTSLEIELKHLQDKLNDVDGESTKLRDTLDCMKSNTVFLEHSNAALLCDKRTLEDKVMELEHFKKKLDSQLTSLSQKNHSLTDRLYQIQQRQKETDFEAQLGVAMTCDVAQQKACALLSEYQTTLKQTNWTQYSVEMLIDMFETFVYRLLRLLGGGRDSTPLISRHQKEDSRHPQRMSYLPSMTNGSLTSRRYVESPRHIEGKTRSSHRYPNGLCIPNNKQVEDHSTQRYTAQQRTCITERMCIPSERRKKPTGYVDEPYLVCHTSRHKYAGKNCTRCQNGDSCDGP